MTVATASTTTTLTLSPAKVSYGSEQAGRLPVKVTAAFTKLRNELARLRQQAVVTRYRP